jgi:hypothetical protein
MLAVNVLKKQSRQPTKGSPLSTGYDFLCGIAELEWFEASYFENIYMHRTTYVRNGCTVLLIYIKAKQSRYTPWWRLGERRYSCYSFFISALDGRDWSASRPGDRTPGTHCTGGWVGLRARLDTHTHTHTYIYIYVDTKAGRPDDRGSIPGGAKDFSSSLCVQTGSGAHPASGGKSAAGA